MRAGIISMPFGKLSVPNLREINLELLILDLIVWSALILNKIFMDQGNSKRIKMTPAYQRSGSYPCLTKSSTLMECLRWFITDAFRESTDLRHVTGTLYHGVRSFSLACQLSRNARVENVFSDGITFYALRECEIRLFVQLESIISVHYHQRLIANKVMLFWAGKRIFLVAPTAMRFSFVIIHELS